MGKKNESDLLSARKQLAINRMNVRRAYLASVSLCGFMIVNIILLNSVFLNERTIDLVLPLAIFTVLLAVIAALSFVANQLKLEGWYKYICYGFLIVMFYYLTRFSIIMTRHGLGMTPYYFMLFICAYVIIADTKYYIAIMACELFAFTTIVLRAIECGNPLTYKDYLFVVMAHALSFLIAMENYHVRDKLVHNELVEKRGTEISEKDPLTGLVNRRGLDKATKKEFAACRENSALVGMAILDIDHFKKYNDKFGHPQGDVCLKAVAKSVSETVGKRGVVSRIGGEEFLIFLYGMEPSEMYSIAEEVRCNVEAMKIQHATGPKDVVTISVGIYVSVPGEKSTFTDFYNKADQLLYKSKTNGRNRVTCNRKVQGTSL